MRSTDKKPTSTNRQVKTKKGSIAAGDADSQRLQKMSKHIGNDVLAKHLQQNSGKRDEILAFICARLQTIQGVQQKELQEMQHEREWFREVAKGVNGFHLPDPTRWHACAEMFKKAALAICNGHLGRGMQLFEQALELEQNTYDTIPRQVALKLEREQRSTTAAPAVSGSIGSNEFCPSVQRPKGLEIADRILNVTAVMEAVAPNPQLWWSTEVEEEEEEEEEEAE